MFQYIDQHFTSKKNTDSIDKLMPKAFHKKISLQLRGMILEHVWGQEDVSLTILGKSSS